VAKQCQEKNDVEEIFFHIFSSHCEC